MKLQEIGFTALLILIPSGMVFTSVFPAPLRETQALAQTSDNGAVEAYRLFQQGTVQYQTSQFEAALQSWQFALTTYRKLQDREGERKALGNLGLAYRALGDYAKAIDYLQQTLDMARELKDRKGEGNALVNLGVTYRNLGDYARAIAYYQQSLDIAREIQDRQEQGNALGSLGNAYSSLKDYTKAIEYYQQWLDISQAIKDRQGEGIALNNLGLVLQAAGELAAAEKTLIEGIKVRESLRAELGNNDANKVSIFETQANTYRILQQVLIAMDKTDAALEIAERGRARAFVELLTSSG